jgi:hypothetical protein
MGSNDKQWHLWPLEKLLAQLLHPLPGSPLNFQAMLKTGLQSSTKS